MVCWLLALVAWLPAHAQERNALAGRFGFTLHLGEAIWLNAQRLTPYAKASGGRSLLVSLPLITSELAILPYATFMDVRSWRFQRQGVPVMAQDFVSMTLSKPQATSMVPSQRLSPADRRELRRDWREARKRLRAAVRSQNFVVVQAEAARVLSTLHEKEQLWQVQFAMTRHLLESLGFIARNAMGYRQQTEGRSDWLMSEALMSHLIAGSPAFWLDLLAQPAHRQGVGVLVNDLPPIDFP